MKNDNPYIVPGSRVAVLGYGVTGRAAVRYALSCGAEVVVSDLRNENVFATLGNELSRLGVLWEAGGHHLEFFKNVDLVLVSPGISPKEPVVQQLRAQNIPFYGELAVLAPVLEKRGAKVVAISGSNGKTTVTSLIGEVLSKTGKSVFVGGNIGVSLYEYCEKGAKEDFVVLEVSSFQLQYAGGFAPDVAVLLNISPDHLDWHGGMENYVAAKMALFGHQRDNQTAVTNRECGEKLPAGFAGRSLVFGREAGDDARIERGGLSLAEKAGELTIALPDSTSGFAAENFAAAALVLRTLEMPPQQIERLFAEFIRPPHRLEIVAELDGVLYLNDSKATNSGAVIGALQQQVRPVILIAGGRGKGENYSLLAQRVKEKVRDVVVIGEAAQEIAAALKDVCSVHFAESLEAAVNLAAGLAVAGEVVLLSPACASFDMFASYGERGECFRKAVQRLESGVKKTCGNIKDAQKIRLLLTGGGTGGHLFPAIATAQKFQQCAQVDVLFIGTRRKLDKESLARYGFAIRTIPSAGIKGKSLGQLMEAFAALPTGFIQALCILREFRPDIVFGVGGYVTAPVIVAAKILGIPVVIHEQNSISGLANRKLAMFAKKICLSLPGSERDFSHEKVVFTGNPVRDAILQKAETEAQEKKSGKTVLILGGSQGAHSLNRMMPKVFMQLWEQGLTIIHQSGAKDAATMQAIRKAYQDEGIKAVVEPFFTDMAEVYAKADLVVSRAGATTLAELAVMGKPAVLIPYPYAADNHQQKNGEYYVKGGGALMFTEEELEAETFANTLARLLKDDERLQQMSAAMKKLAVPDAAERIVDVCRELVVQKSKARGR